METGVLGVLGMVVLFPVEGELKQVQDNAMIHQCYLEGKNARVTMKELKIVMSKIAQVRRNILECTVKLFIALFLSLYF